MVGEVRGLIGAVERYIGGGCGKMKPFDIPLP